MATADGSWCGGDDYKAHLVVSTSTSDTAVTITSECWLYSWYGYCSGMTTTGTAKVGSQQASSTIYSFGSDSQIKMATKVVTVSRTTSAQVVRCQAVVSSYCGTSTATYDVTVPALASYAVGYDANGGSGAPSSQTKYHGVGLALSSAVPSRANYSFVAWNTASDGTGTTYQPGDTYAGNAAVTLYAVWELALVVPTLVGVELYRTAGDTSTRDEEGTRANITVPWSVNTTTNGAGNEGCRLTAQWRPVGVSFTAANTTTMHNSSSYNR